MYHFSIQGGIQMSVNGITGTTSAADLYKAYQTKDTKDITKGKTTEKTEKTDKAAETEQKSASTGQGVVYEPSADATAKTYKTNPELIAKLKADAEAKTAQLENLVKEMFQKQGKTFGQTDDMWKFLASGDFTVDAQTKADAEAAISEDGYWGVKQTSDRIFEFASALTGGDPTKMEEMREAVKKGFEEATKSWGKELPDITTKTYDAVMAKFDKFQEDAKANTAATQTEQI